MIPKLEPTKAVETMPEARPPAATSEPVEQAREPAPPPKVEGPVNADLRLVIEEIGGGPGGYVYKTIDRRTGEVVNQFPREEILRIRQSADYSAGQVVKAKV